MDAEGKIFGLMAVAEDQQNAISRALEDLTAERKALAEERAELARVARGIEASAHDAVSSAARQSLAGASEAAVAAMAKATAPFILEIRAIATHASETTGRLESVGQWLGRRTILTAAGCLIVVFIGAWGLVAWNRHEVAVLRQQQEDLAATISREQATVAQLDKAYGRVRWTTCGGRPCFEAAEDQGTAQDGSRLQIGDWSWTHDGSKGTLVIPEGY